MSKMWQVQKEACFFLSIDLLATQNMSNIRVEVPRSLDAKKWRAWMSRDTHKLQGTYHIASQLERILTTPILLYLWWESWKLHVFLTRLAIVRNTIKRKVKGRCINHVFIALSTSTRNGLPSLKLYVHSWRVCV
jgi:hypothetical protein